MMDDNMLSGAMLPGSSAGMLELEGLHHHHHPHHQIAQQQQQQQQRHHAQLAAHHQHLQSINVVPISHNGGSGLESDQSLSMMDCKGTPKSSLVSTKGRTATSDEDEPSFTEDGIDSQSQGGGGKSKKNSPWQRMKWTDAMVRLLITVVLYVGEDAAPECSEGNKRKAGIMQKKGKWKTVSNYMVRKGCFVSPQQCEDKFNDLNKRYKRLNDILGKGTTCKVVENPSLLDNMAHLSAKTKEDVRKLLSSKHLFYKEMCAYHNGTRMQCHAETDSHSPRQSLMVAKDKEGLDSCGLIKDDGIGVPEGEDNEDDNDDEEEEDDEEDEDDACDDEIEGDMDVEGLGEVEKRRLNKTPEDFSYWVRPVSSQWPQLSGTDNLNAEHTGLSHDGNKSSLESREWIRKRTLQLKEQKVALQVQAFELEKRRFKWQKTCAKRDREIEKMKIENEKMKLENERMSLQLKQRELDVEYKRSEAAMTSVALALDGVPGREQNELARGQCLQ